jgi:hypothetical protein
VSERLDAGRIGVVRVPGENAIDRRLIDMSCRIEVGLAEGETDDVDTPRLGFRYIFPNLERILRTHGGDALCQNCHFSGTPFFVYPKPSERAILVRLRSTRKGSTKMFEKRLSLRDVPSYKLLHLHILWLPLARCGIAIYNEH